MAKTPHPDLATWSRAGVTYRVQGAVNGTGASLLAIGPGLVVRHGGGRLTDAIVATWLAANEEERTALAEEILQR